MGALSYELWALGYWLVRREMSAVAWLPQTAPTIGIFRL